MKTLTLLFSLSLFIIFGFQAKSQTVVDIVVNSENHNTLETAVVQAGLAETLAGEGPFTVFAPTDAAFEALPEGTVEALMEDPTGDLKDILMHHVVGAAALSNDLSDGQTIETLLGKEVTVAIMNGNVYIGDAMVTVADIETDNGVVHVVDAVILPPVTTVVDIVVNSENHNTLETAVVAAGLAETLAGEGPFTVFAPTDAAFEALPEGTLEALLEDPSGQLTDILLYHVVGGSAYAEDLSSGQEVETLSENDITINIMEETVYINSAMVTVADIETDNGVVHVIDAVLIPSQTTSAIDVKSFNSMDVYPNPATDQLKLNIKVDDSQQIATTVYNIVGEKVISNSQRHLTPGEHQITKDVSSLNPGVYLIHLDNERSSEIVRFLKQ